MRLRLVLLVCALAGVGVSTATAGGAPPGATARCRDGTYSYSHHHAGTCSHHGGVAKWLDGSKSGGSASGSRTVATGSTILLDARTKRSGCRLGSEPDRRCSPGAFYSRLSSSVLCSSGFTTRSIRDVSYSERYAVEREYGLAARHYGATLEIDHIVPLELGGSNAVANLFPERAPGYHAKDRLENRLHALVCAGELSLRSARRGIAADWKRLYRTVFGAAALRHR